MVSRAIFRGNIRDDRPMGVEFSICIEAQPTARSAISFNPDRSDHEINEMKHGQSVIYWHKNIMASGTQICVNYNILELILTHKLFKVIFFDDNNCTIIVILFMTLIKLSVDIPQFKILQSLCRRPKKTKRESNLLLKLSSQVQIQWQKKFTFFFSFFHCEVLRTYC